MNTSHSMDADIIIVGGGHAGLTQSLLLADKGFQVICLDRDTADHALDKNTDGRTTAISYGSHQLFKAAGIWNDLLPYACPIKDIEILDGNSPVLLDFSRDDIGANKDGMAFGWIIENHIIKQVLFSAAQNHKNITHETEYQVSDFEQHEQYITVINNQGARLSAALVIGADGRKSFTREWMNVGAREWSYNQSALVTMVTHENPHNNIAIEHFLPDGPFAILPMQDDEQGNHRSTLVWTQHSDHNSNALHYDDDTFLTALNARFPELYGQILSAGKRFTYPLNLIHAYSYIAPRMVLIADAAHGIHPIAGQGLNLGLRDVAALTEILNDAKEKQQDIGSINILEKYQSTRRPDNMAMSITTDLINKLFSNNLTSAKIARKIGLKLIQKLKPTKRFFMSQAMGTAGHLPKMIRKENTK